MKYLIQGEDGKEYGPIDEETLRKWTEAGRIVPHTPVRNTLIKKWNKASDLDFLLPAFAVQGSREEKEKGALRRFSDHLNAIFGGGKANKKKEETPWETSFKNKYIHDPASISVRLAAFSFDLIIIGGFAIFLLLHFSASFTHPERPVQKETSVSDLPPASTTAPAPDTAKAAPTAGSTASPASAGSDTGVPKAQEAPPSPESVEEVNSAFNRSFYIFVTCILLYYGLSLGIFAQTFGMWFWGLIIAKTDLGEVLFGRAYFFTVLMLLIGVLSPLVVYFNPYKRSLHEILSGTMIIRTAARPKA